MKLNQLFFCGLVALVCFFITVNASTAVPAVKETTIRAATDNADIKLTVPDQFNCTIASVSTLDEGVTNNTTDSKSVDLEVIKIVPIVPDDPGYDYPFGLVEFTLDCTAEESEGPLAVYIDVMIIPDSGPVDLTNYRYRKYGPLPNGMTVVLPPNGELNGEPNGVYENGISQWYDFMYDGQTGAQLINSNTFRLYFVDGQRGDDGVGILDKIIFDQGGAAPVPTVPTMSEWGMIMFMVLSGLGSLYYLKRKRVRV